MRQILALPTFTFVLYFALIWSLAIGNDIVLRKVHADEICRAFSAHGNVRVLEMRRMSGHGMGHLSPIEGLYLMGPLYVYLIFPENL
jgi:hypothetical protein